MKKLTACFVLLALLSASVSVAAQPATLIDTGINVLELTATSLPVSTPTGVPSATPAATPATTPKATPTATPKTVYPVLLWGDSGDAVINLQSRLKDLGYYNYKVTGYFGQLTAYAVQVFQKCNKLPETGNAGELTNAVLYTNDAVRMPMNAIETNVDRIGQTPTPIPTKKPTAAPTKKATAKPKATQAPVKQTGKVAVGEYLDWSTVKTLFAKGKTAVITDFLTGISWNVKRTGGSKHADVEPVSSADTAKYKQACGSKWKKWDRHSAVVTVAGKRIAASYHGMPHGYDALSGNDLTGHFCIHFKNSRTHCSNSIDSRHQACVRQAAGR